MDAAREILLNVVKVLQRPINKGPGVAAHGCTFFSTSITSWRKVFSADGVSQSPNILRSLAMHRPEARGELMQFLQAAT